MKAEQWIIGGGVIFCLIVFGAAMLPDSFLGRVISNPIVAQQSGNPDASPGAGADMGAAPTQNFKATMPGLIPFSRATSERFRGKVVRMVSWGSDNGWGQIHIWVDDGTGPSREVSVAPDWYLQHLGCRITENVRVQGVAFNFSKSKKDGELYAKGITVDGNSCRLRNDEGFALWSNRLR